MANAWEVHDKGKDSKRLTTIIGSALSDKAAATSAMNFAFGAMPARRDAMREQISHLTCIVLIQMQYCNQESFKAHQLQSEPKLVC